MRKLLIIGYGNPLRTDDGIGWHIAQELALTSDLPDVEIIARVQLTPELAEPISRSDLVLFIDASRECKPGHARQERVFAKEATVTLNHQITPEGLLQLADDVYYSTPEAHVFSIGAESFEYGAALSPRMAAQLPNLLAKVREFIRCQCRVSA